MVVSGQAKLSWPSQGDMRVDAAGHDNRTACIDPPHGFDAGVEKTDATCPPADEGTPANLRARGLRLLGAPR